MHEVEQKQKVFTIPGDLSYTPNPARHRFDVKRCTIWALILSLAALAAYSLSLRLISQVYYLRAKNFMQQGYYGLATQGLQTAAAYNPNDYKIQRQWGHAVHRLAEIGPNPKRAYALSEKAKARYQEAFRLNPLDAQSVYGLAWQEDRLELLYTKLKPGEKNNPHNALPFYERAISLRPNGIRYHYALARYLHRRGKQDELQRVMRNLARIYPPAFSKLKKSDFWSPAVKIACRQGLQEAIKDNILPAAAHLALVDMAAEDKDWADAIAHYQQALQVQPRDKTGRSDYRLGQLFLKNGDVKAARASFLKSLAQSRTREKLLESIYGLFKNEGALNEFSGFYHEVRQQFDLSAQSGILLARSFMDLKQFDQARRVLEELKTDKPSAEAYYWLAQIARNEKDWDRMERAIQKATALEPENINYRHIFFNLLKKRKKFESAELQLDLLIDYSETASASLFDEKAWLRWRQKDYSAAVEAWQSAIRLNSDAAVYYARAAEAYAMIGDWSNAVAYFQKAARRDPQNKQYKKRYREIVGDDSEE